MDITHIELPKFARRAPADCEIRFRVDESLYRALVQGAEAEGRPLAEFARRMMETSMFGIAANHPGIRMNKEASARVLRGPVRER